MKILVACEFSGTVRDCLIDRGHEAYSCDLIDPIFEDNLPCGVHTENHIVGDVRNLLNDTWDAIIAHRPCTYLAHSGVQWLFHPSDTHLNFYDRRPHPKFPHRKQQLKLAVEFFKLFLDNKCPKICVENPVPHKFTTLPRYTQKLKPTQFGHFEEKSICLWLKGLKPLTPTDNVCNVTSSLPYTERQKTWGRSETKNRPLLRSITFSGLAEAMASQWF
jgi:hypothetical protein